MSKFEDVAFVLHAAPLPFQSIANLLLRPFQKWCFVATKYQTPPTNLHAPIEEKTCKVFVTTNVGEHTDGPQALHGRDLYGSSDNNMFKKKVRANTTDLGRIQSKSPASENKRGTL